MTMTILAVPSKAKARHERNIQSEFNGSLTRVRGEFNGQSQMKQLGRNGLYQTPQQCCRCFSGMVLVTIVVLLPSIISAWPIMPTSSSPFSNLPRPHEYLRDSNRAKTKTRNFRKTLLLGHRENKRGHNEDEEPSIDHNSKIKCRNEVVGAKEDLKSKSFYKWSQVELINITTTSQLEQRSIKFQNLPHCTTPMSFHSSITTTTNSRRNFLKKQIFSSFFASSSITCPCDAAENSNVVDSAGETNGYFSIRNNNNIPYAQRQQIARQQTQQQQQQQKMLSSLSSSKKWTPFANVNKWDKIETVLLEMLPVKNGVFRRLQGLIQDLKACEADDIEGWKESLTDATAALMLLESKRSSLEPVFNQQDPTALFISKTTIGERNIEVLRSKLEYLVKIATALSADESTDLGNDANRAMSNMGKNSNKINHGIDNTPSTFLEGKRRALWALSEVGELLVSSFPYAVPTRGKFGYLPRLLGRCTVTFFFERNERVSPEKFFGGDRIQKRPLGNVTIVADGYAAPITAGNFVDLSLRNFYTGLSVKAMRKRLGVVPSWSDNVIVNDLTAMKDNLDVLKDDFGSALGETEAMLLQQGGGAGSNSGGPGVGLGRFGQDESEVSGGISNRGLSGFFRSTKSENDFSGYSNNLAESMYDENDSNRMTMDVILPILGSFQEGFYDPLTAKPRRIPLEIVALDGTSPNKATLTYSSSFASLDDDVTAAGTTKYSALKSSSSPQRSFSSSISSSSSFSSTTATNSNLRPVLSFDIPGLVALNHPDRVSNGGSSEFFALPNRDVSSKRTKLLDGQYAPFGYIVEGSDVYQCLRPGDFIGATYVSELGALNLVKIRKNAFESDEENMADNA